MTPPPMTLCVINHNGAAHLRRALAALDDLPRRFDEILVVDNASDDDSRDVIAEVCPDARVLALPDNLGPGRARNAGFDAARNDLILFQDNDVVLNADTADRLLACLRAGENTLAVAPRVLYASDPARIQFEGADCHFTGFMITRNADVPASEAATDAAARTTSFVTACFLIDRRRWSGGSLFDDSLGFNLEDHDFGVRANVLGHELWVDPSATVLHGSGTPGLSYRPGQQPDERRLFYLTRNRWIVIVTCFSVRTLIVLAPALVLLESMQLVWLILEGRGSTWWRAVRSFTPRLPAIHRKRHEVQRGRRRPDAGILRGGPLPLTEYVRRSGPKAMALTIAERILRGYWRLVRGWM